MTKKGSLDFLLLIYYIESRRRLQDLYPDEGNKVKMVHYNQLINNKLPLNEGFEGKKTGYRAKSSL